MSKREFEELKVHYQLLAESLEEVEESLEREQEINRELLEALEAIADMRVAEDTNHAELSALCVAIASAAIAKVPK